MSEIYNVDEEGQTLAREELVDADIGSAWQDVVFDEAIASGNLPDRYMLADGVVFRVRGSISLHAIGEAVGEDADFRVQVRNTAQGAWVTLGSETTVTAGEAATVYQGNVRAHELKFQVKYTTDDGGSGAIGACFK